MWEEMPGQATFDGKTYDITHAYNDGDLHLRTKNDGDFVFPNAYPTKLKYGFGDDSDSCESVTLVGNNKEWKSNADKTCTMLAGSSEAQELFEKHHS